MFSIDFLKIVLSTEEHDTNFAYRDRHIYIKKSCSKIFHVDAT